MFSEGWHEIEHDFRYKCKEDWYDNEDLSRTLNGVIATLENCDWAIASLFDDLAYRHYKKMEWEPMMKNKLRIRMRKEKLNGDIEDIFNNDNKIAKLFYRAERDQFLVTLSEIKNAMPLTFSNVIFLLNETQVHNQKISNIAPNMIKNVIGLNEHN